MVSHPSSCTLRSLAVPNRQLGCNDFSALRLDLLDGLFFLIIDDALFLEVLNLPEQSACRVCRQDNQDIPNCVRSFSRRLDRPGHTLLPPPLSPSWCLCCRGCCSGRGIRRRRLATRSISAVLSWSGRQMRRRLSFWAPRRRKKMRTSPLCRGGSLS